MAAIVESSDDAILSKAPSGEILTWNRAAEGLYGYSADEAVGRSISILIPPDRAGEERKILDQIMAGKRVDHYETERVRKDGRIVSVALTASPVRNETGEVVAASVIARNISERKRAEERATGLQAVTAALSQALMPEEVVDLVVREVVPAAGSEAGGVALLSEDGSVLELVSSIGYTEEGLAAWKRFPVDADLPLSKAVRERRPIWTASAEDLVARFPALAGSNMRFPSLAAVPLVAAGRAIGGVALSFDEPDTLTAEDRAFILAVAQQAAYALARGQAYERERSARAEAERTREQLGFLSRASEILAESLELDTTLQRVADLAVPGIADWCSVDLAADDGAGIRQVAVAHVDPAKVELAVDLRRRYPIDPAAPGGVSEVIRTGAPALYPELSDQFLEEAAQDQEHLELMRALGLTSALVVPMSARGRVLGAVTLVGAESGRRYGEADIALAQDLARRAALAVDNSLLYREEHHAAVTLQRSMLPAALPEVDGIELAARYLPGGSGVEIGGDWYDALAIEEELVVAVGDVAGRGIQAASVMGQMRNALRAYAFDRQPPVQAVERLNRLATTVDTPEMATLFYLVFDRRHGRAEYVRAGHPPPVIRRPDGSVARLEGEGCPPIGVAPAARFRSAIETLPPGTLVLLYTDGLIERRGQSIEVQLEKLERAMGDSPPEPSACCDFLLARLGVDESGEDDTAILAVRV